MFLFSDYFRLFPISPIISLQLLLEHENEIAPDNGDPIHETLEELGGIPEVATLIGKFFALW